jgi:hypothetical protein
MHALRVPQIATISRVCPRGLGQALAVTHIWFRRGLTVNTRSTVPESHWHCSDRPLMGLYAGASLLPWPVWSPVALYISLLVERYDGLVCGKWVFYLYLITDVQLYTVV